MRRVGVGWSCTRRVYGLPLGRDDRRCAALSEPSQDAAATVHAMASQPIPTAAARGRSRCRGRGGSGRPRSSSSWSPTASLILAMWLRHGGLEQLSTTAGTLTAIGQLTALFGTYLALIQLVLMSRSPWLDQAFGMDGLAVAHRWLGFGTVWLLLGHGVFTTVGYALGDGSNVVEEFWTLITTYPYVLMATGQRRPLRGGRDQLDARRPPEAVVRDVVRASTSTRTWRSPSASSTSSSSGRTSSHDPVAVAYWVAPLPRRRSRSILVFRVGEPVWLLDPPPAAGLATSSPKAPGVISIYMTGPGSRSARGPLRASTSSGASSPATAGGAAIRSRSRPPPTGRGCGSRSRSSATGRRRSRASRSGRASSSKARTAS